MSAVSRWLRSADGRWLIALFLLAFVIRLLVALDVRPDPRDGRFDDTVWYDTAARHIAAGDGYVFDPTVWFDGDGNRVFPDENDLTPTALWPPGYPITLAAIYKLTGDSVAAARFANVVFGSLTVALVFLIGRKLFDRRTAVLGAAALALMPSHVLFTTMLLCETYFGFLLALTLAVAVYFVLDRKQLDATALAATGALGVLIAATGYVRGEFMAFGGVMALIIALRYKREAPIALAVLALGATLIVVPWTLRNRSSMGEPIIGTTGSGRVAYQGHNPLANGGPSLEAVGILEAPFQGYRRDVIERKSSERGQKEAREWAMDHKVRELQLVGLRMWQLFRNDEAGVTWLQSNKPWFGEQNAHKLIVYSTFWFWMLAALMLGSLPRWWRWRDPKRWAVFSIVPFYMLTFGVLFIGDPRYHYALYIPMSVFAGAGLSAVFGLTAAHWREVAGGRSFGSVLRTFGTPEP